MGNKFAIILGIGVAAAAIIAAVALSDARKVPGETNSSSLQPTVMEPGAEQESAPKEVPVRGDLKSLVVSADDLPGEFPIARGEAKGTDEFAQIYFNPRSFQSTDKARAGLLGVIVNLTLLDDGQAARAKYVAQGGLDADSVLEDIPTSTPGADPRGVTPYTMTLPGADRVLAFRVHYVLQGIEVYERRIRLIVGNALVNLIVSARATDAGGEPADLEQLARTIVERQVARLTAARG